MKPTEFFELAATEEGRIDMSIMLAYERDEAEIAALEFMRLEKPRK